MPNPRRTKVSKGEQVITVKKLRDILTKMEAEKSIQGDTEIWVSSDEEGNQFSPLMIFKGGSLNVGVEEDKARLTMYPSSSHSEDGW